MPLRRFAVSRVQRLRPCAVTPIDWLWILHPLLMVVIAYPLLGIVLFLARRTRLRRLGQSRMPASSGAEHTDLGRALAAAVVAITLVALAVVIGTKAPLDAFPGGGGRLALLLVVALGTALALVSLLRVRAAALRGAFALLTWIGMLGLGSQPEVWRLSDDPFSPTFWQSHYWGGAGLIGLLRQHLLFQKHVELQQLFIAQLLAAAQLKLLLQQLAASLGVPLQAAQQLIALLQQVAAPQGHRRRGGIRAGWKVAQAAQIAHQIGIGGEAVAAGVPEGPLQVNALLVAVPADPLQLHVQLCQFIAPVVGIGGWFRCRRGVRGVFGRGRGFCCKQVVLGGGAGLGRGVACLALRVPHHGMAAGGRIGQLLGHGRRWPGQGGSRASRGSAQPALQPLQRPLFRLLGICPAQAAVALARRSPAPPAGLAPRAPAAP